MPAPTHSELGALLGTQVSTEQGVACLEVITAMANAYTRGQGFTDGKPNSDIRAAILVAAARLLSNPRGLLIEESEGPATVNYRSSFQGWTAAELYVLNRYRVRAC